MLFASERDTLNSAVCNTMRGSGDHHRSGSPSENHGKIPLRYAMSRRSVDRSAPAASRPLGCVSACAALGKGVCRPSQGITFSAADLLAAVVIQLVDDRGAGNGLARSVAQFERELEFVLGEKLVEHLPAQCA